MKNSISRPCLISNYDKTIQKGDENRSSTPIGT